MPRAGNPFLVDWTNLSEVKAYVDKLGPGQLVVLYPGRTNYNITHAAREQQVLREHGTVVYRTHHA